MKYFSLDKDQPLRIGKGGKGENEWEYIIEDLRQNTGVDILLVLEYTSGVDIFIYRARIHYRGRRFYIQNQNTLKGQTFYFTELDLLKWGLEALIPDVCKISWKIKVNSGKSYKRTLAPQCVHGMKEKKIEPRKGMRKTCLADKTNLSAFTDESQWIAVWQLLYQVRHRGRYISRLQTIWDQNSDNWMVRKDKRTSSTSQEPGTGVEAKPIVPRTDLQPNSKVAMSRRVSALEAFRHIPTDGSFAPSADRLSTCTKCPNLRFLSY